MTTSSTAAVQGFAPNRSKPAAKSAAADSVSAAVASRVKSTAVTKPKPVPQVPTNSAKLSAGSAAPKTKPTATPVFATKDAREKKPKLVRDSFTIPKDEYVVIEILKQRADSLSQPAKKSELLRAGLKVLAGLSDAALRTALQSVPSIKTGRPKKEVSAKKSLIGSSRK